MKCPTCKDVNLLMSDWQGIEIECCLDCIGVWLDRSKIYKIIEYSAHQQPPAIGCNDFSCQKQGDDKDNYLNKRKNHKTVLSDFHF
ncbi:MAG: zf-TFIIB domain-containing protein [Desulfatirhabdiaceae bacterium]|nr:zf-TFIIB domain-containing protein [Desulfatirhabdiaceae bacterium]